MKNLVNTYMDQFRQDRQKQLKLAAVLAALAVIVAGVVFWQLHSTGVAMSNEIYCGMEEHVHDDSCYEQVLICDSEEDGHVHDDTCYETVLACQIPEHTHTIECMTDETADVETADIWEATLPALTGNWSHDVAAVAESQIGYTESTANFVLAEDGETHMGYTRYGAWYGNEYGDWDAMFVSFCLNQAGVPRSVVPGYSGAYAMAAAMAEDGLYVDTAEFTPAAGDVIFFDDDGDSCADRAGIVAAAGENELTVVEGDFGDAVAENTYDKNDAGILAFGILPDQGSREGTETVEGDLVYSADDGGVSVSVTAPAGSLPENAELSVMLLDEDSEDYAEAVQAVNADVETLSAGAADRNVAVLDISFLADGAEVEPAGAVTVSIDASGLVPEDAGSVTIRHLEETGAGIVPVVVAELDASNPFARFEVESFSKFEIDWNDGTGDSIMVHVYNMNGTGIEEVLDTEYEHNGGDILISDIVTHLHQNNEYVASYTFQYATIYYETASGMGNQLTAETVGSETNSVVEISKNGTTYTVRLADGTTTTISDPDTIDIHMYYSLPTVEISATSGEHTDTVGLTTTNTYFQGLDASDSNVTYTWVLSDDYRASVTNNEDGTATFTWNTDYEDLSAGDTVDVIVTMTNTYTDENGNTVTEQASDTYTLTYGEVQVTISVSNIPTYSGQSTPGSTASTTYGVAYVAIVDENGNTVTTAEINNGSTSGTVTVWVAPGTYTVGVTGICGDDSAATTTVRSSGEATLAVTDAGGSATVTLGDTVTSGSSTGGVIGSNGETGTWGSSVYYYEHIDVKIAIAELEGMNETFSDLDSVYVFDKYGNLIFSSNDLIYNAETDDYNCLFDVGNASDIHSLAVSSEDTIVITYEVIDENGETKTYTAVISADSTYAEGEYYQYDDINAYQLYNCIHGTSISEDDWAAALANGTLQNLLGDNYDPNGISIAGLSYIQVADYLCDTRADDAGQHAGLDFVIDVSALEVTSVDLRVAKNYTGVPDTETVDENTVFEFDLIELDSKYITTGTMTWFTTDGSDDTDAWVLDHSTGQTGSWENTADNVWSSIVSFDRTFEYESESGTNFYYYILRETSYVNAEPVVQYYGIIVNVSFEGALPEISVSYAEMTCTDPDEGLYGTYEIISGTYRQLNLTYVRDDEGNITESYYALPFGNAYDAGIKIEKRAMTSTGESGDIVYADFTLTRVREVTDEDTGTTDTYYEYYQPAGTDDEEAEWVSYDPDDSVTLPDVTLGSINFGILDDGVYTLTETAAPDGYYPLDESINFTILNGVITQATYGGSNDSEYISVSEDELTLTVNNESSVKLPDAGGIGTWIYTAAGLLLIGGAASLLVYRKRRAVRS